MERAYPELVGGAGTYRSTAAHGPFVHIDARADDVEVPEQFRHQARLVLRFGYRLSPRGRADLNARNHSATGRRSRPEGRRRQTREGEAGRLRGRDRFGHMAGSWTLREVARLQGRILSVREIGAGEHVLHVVRHRVDREWRCQSPEFENYMEAVEHSARFLDQLQLGDKR